MVSAFLRSGFVCLLGVSVACGVRAEITIAVDQFYVDLAPYIVQDLQTAYRNIGEDPIITILPGERAIQLANVGKYDALDARFKGTPNIDNLVAVDVPIYAKGNTLAWAVDSNIRVFTVEDLKNYRIASPLGSAVVEKLNQEWSLNITFVPQLEQAIKMADAGRVDIVLTSDVYIQMLRSRGQELNLTPVSPALHSEWVYHHVHKSHADLVPKLEVEIKRQQESEGLFYLR